MGNQKSVVAVVVTWNRRELLKQNLNCLLEQKDAHCDILLVDNASTDGTAEMVKNDFCDSRIHYVNTGANLGGSGGFEFGIDKAVGMGYDYVWIMDDDSMPQPNALKELLIADEALEGSWGFLSSAVYWTDGSVCKANRVKKDLFRHVKEEEYKKTLVPIVMGSFVSMLVPSKVIREVGLPIGEYFIWTDDYEFSARISKRYPCYLVASSKVTHAMANNTRANLVTADDTRIARFHYLYRNDVHCYRQQGLLGYSYLLAKGVFTAADVALHAKDSKIQRLKIMLQGYSEGLSFHPVVREVKDTANSSIM